MSAWNSSWLRTLLVPGGVLFLACALLFAVYPLAPATLAFYYYATFLGGLALAWRFHSGRAFAAVILVFLAHRAVEFFAAGHSPIAAPGRTALDAVSFLLAANLVWLSLDGEFGFSISAIAPRLGVLFLESVFVAVICRPQPAWGSNLFRVAWLPPAWFSWTHLSQISCLAIAFAVTFLLILSAISRKQIDAGLAWALAAAGCAFSSGGIGRVANEYIATAGLLLLVSVVETSYRMAYHDELTGIPSRRALNDSTRALQTPYAVAVVDVDHFKKFNDTYGHDTGDEVLRMVARRLANVTGGGQAFRVGGEEFTILFAGKRAEETIPHLEQLREAVETTSFRLRGADRRVVARGPERRQAASGSAKVRRPETPPRGNDLNVTVSIGAAQSREGSSFDATLQRADKALYRAKQNGRNRVEIDGRSPEISTPTRRKKSRAKTA